ncbi:hypothetical protein EC957_009966 [Mortierella hygrophila]|uniref:Uncharacterized protein n=1 Tax=Mortierella hygrophila TaxID=979708 RepID=A0A9P6FAG2_9FUNG|nr:hypothetical protein EC957_009966 [Mortierella hygrophila]
MTPSYSSIHAASMDPSSVSVSVSVSASLPTPPTSFSGVRSDNNNNNNRSNGDSSSLESSETTSPRTNRRSNSADGIVAGSSFNFTSSNPDESRHQYQLAQPTTTTLPSSSLSTNNHNSNSNSNTTQSARSEVDDRIHFRLLDGIYFSAPPRPLRHDDDLGMDSPPHSQTRSDLQYIDIQDTNFSDQEDEYMHDNNAMEDLDFGESQPQHSMYDGQGNEFASVTFRRRSSHPELIEEEEEEEEPRQLNSRHRNILQHADDDDDDDEDDGIDEVMEGHPSSACTAFAPFGSRADQHVHYGTLALATTFDKFVDYVRPDRHIPAWCPK